ncbi:MAG: hypothetical protein ACR2MY_13720 [Candidatus Dormibacteria bacterium]
MAGTYTRSAASAPVASFLLPGTGGARRLAESLRAYRDSLPILRIFLIRYSAAVDDIVLPNAIVLSTNSGTIQPEELADRGVSQGAIRLTESRLQ